MDQRLQFVYISVPKLEGYFTRKKKMKNNKDKQWKNFLTFVYFSIALESTLQVRSLLYFQNSFLNMKQ